MNINIDFIIYIYLIACITLLTFDVAYIFQTKRKNRYIADENKKWFNETLRQIKRIMEGKEIEQHHVRKLSKQLVKIDALISYTQAIDLIKNEFPEPLMDYIHKNYPIFQELAHKYGRKDSMERAFYADFVRRFPFYNGGEYKPILDILIAYMDNSSVFCRENVLCALYALGNVRAVENAFQIINDRGWFHHQKLISDGLVTFTGDKQALAAVLWSKYKKWNDYLTLAVIQFITLCSSDYKDIFLSVLKDSNADIEIRLAVMRYFRRYLYEPVRPLLTEYLTGGSQINENIAIVAASVLGKYPGSDTVESLINALGSPNWYVRYNAASSIVDVGASEAELRVVLEGNDKYAREILLYKLYQEGYENKTLRKAVYA